LDVLNLVHGEYYTTLKVQNPAFKQKDAVAGAFFHAHRHYPVYIHKKKSPTRSQQVRLSFRVG
jgi:hypothetical protein